MYLVYFQLPPTPTPLPPPAEVPLPALDNYSLWDQTDFFIQGWNSASEVTLFFQAMILVGVVLFILGAIYKRARYISVDNND